MKSFKKGHNGETSFLIYHRIPGRYQTVRLWKAPSIRLLLADRRDHETRRIRRAKCCKLRTTDSAGLRCGQPYGIPWDHGKEFVSDALSLFQGFVTWSLKAMCRSSRREYECFTESVHWIGSPLQELTCTSGLKLRADSFGLFRVDALTTNGSMLKKENVLNSESSFTYWISFCHKLLCVWSEIKFACM